MISVIVPTFNRREVLSRCLQALAQQDCPQSAFEVIVVVKGSTDGTQAFLDSLQTSLTLKVIDQANRGAAAARNTGLLAAAHKIVFFLDDNLICEPKAISEHIRAHESQTGILAFGPVLVQDRRAGSAAKRATRKFYADEVYGPLETGEAPAWPIHARVPPNSSIEKELLLSFGGYDETFGTAHEDVELGIGLWRGGVKFLYLPNAKVEHEYSKSARELTVVEAERAGKSEVLLCRKHGEYRAVSQISGVKETRLFRYGSAGFVLRSKLVRPMVDGCFGIGRRLSAKEDRLLGVESNLNLLRSAVREAGSWKTFRSEFWMELPVLLYHHIGQPRHGAFPELTIEPGHFEIQMQWLKDNAYTPITPGDWLLWRKSAVSLPEKPVLITFDDAYEDLVRHAFPVLRKHEFPATVFVPTAYVGRSNVWDHPKGSRSSPSCRPARFANGQATALSLERTAARILSWTRLTLSRLKKN